MDPFCPYYGTVFICCGSDGERYYEDTGCFIRKSKGYEVREGYNCDSVGLWGQGGPSHKDAAPEN